MSEALQGKPLLRVESLTKAFGGAPAVDAVSFEIAHGEFFALLGPSGCGKTTLMRMIAGLERPDAGRVLVDGEDVTETPAHRRPVNMMFQSYALFPHLDVARNVAFGLVQARLPRRKIEARVAEMLKLVQLGEFAARKPAQLSGGQKQRVALARALARNPKLLLLDEPLAALDRKLREETQFELRDVQRRLGASFMLVTHDQDEAMAMAQRIAVMRSGRIEQIGTPREVYDRPANRWVAGFIGEVNLFDVQLEAKADGRLLMRAAGGERFEALAAEGDFCVGDRLTLALRPERVVLSAQAESVDFAQGEILDSFFRGEATVWRVGLRSGAVVRAARASHAEADRLSPGARVFLRCAPEAARLLSA